MLPPQLPALVQELVWWEPLLKHVRVHRHPATAVEANIIVARVIASLWVLVFIYHFLLIDFLPKARVSPGNPNRTASRCGHRNTTQRLGAFA